MIILNIAVSVIIMVLVILVAKLKTELNIERIKVDTYRDYALKLNHKIRLSFIDLGIE
tara:strand:+ start:651 stop:824 length:174 start_codon:yes stop_codon:yes gene_type:complete